jgi:hypothetical protein
VTFDIERYKGNSHKLDLSDIRWDLVRKHELPRSAIDSMLYMMDIETHTVIVLSELLVSKACMDPVIRSFLSYWVYEEMYHGEAFVQFLREYGIPVSDDRPKEIRLRKGFKRINAVMSIMFGSYLIPFFPAPYLCCTLARQFGDGLSAGGCEILNEVGLNQVLVAFGDDVTTNAVIAGVQKDGTCWCGGTVWQGRAAMRISVSSWATTPADVDQSVAAILRVAKAQSLGGGM